MVGSLPSDGVTIKTLGCPLTAVIFHQTDVASVRAYGVKIVPIQMRMKRRSKNSIPDRSGPGLTTAAISAVAQQGAGGNYATVGAKMKRRQRGGKQAQRQLGRRKARVMDLRVGTLNVGSMTGKGSEIVDMMDRRKVDILCVQEIKWKGSKARELGNGYKLYFHGLGKKGNGIGIILKPELTKRVMEVRRVSDRVLEMKLEIGKEVVNVVTANAPLVGCDTEEKEEFWTTMDKTVTDIPKDEWIFVGVDLNGHVG